MHSNIPFKSLVKYSFWFSLSVGTSAFVSSSMTDTNWQTLLFRSVSIFFHFFIISFCNILLLQRLEKRRLLNGLIQDQLKVFGLGYIMTLVLVSFFVLINILIRRFEGINEIMTNDNFTQNGNIWQMYLMIPYIGLIIYSIVYFFHNFFLLHHLKSKKELEVAELKTLNSEKTNQLLRQQIQPHFLFNALNTLKSLIKKNPDQAEEYVIHLSEFLRASITDNRNQTAKVNDELKICSDYMKMQKIRFGEALLFNIDIEDHDPRLQQMIPNFSLQPLIENAIKHNQFTLINPLEIRVFFKENKICVSNPIRLRKMVEHSTGNGLFNLQQRCRIIYNEDLLIINESSNFEVQLKLI